VKRDEHPGIVADQEQCALHTCTGFQPSQTPVIRAAGTKVRYPNYTAPNMCDEKAWQGEFVKSIRKTTNQQLAAQPIQHRSYIRDR